MTYGTVNADVIGTSVAGSNLGAGNASIMKNRIINGAMVISQRFGTASTGNILGAAYTVDRCKTIVVGGTSTLSAQQSTDAPVGFSNSVVYTVGIGATPAGTEERSCGQAIEANNMADLGYGTANAKTITLSFWVKSSLTGTFGVSFSNAAFNRSYVTSYTISVANTWEYKTITITGDTTGTWQTGVNLGMSILFDLGVGTTYSGSATGAWQAATYEGLTGGVKLTATAGATWALTGFQLEVGSSATGFEYVNYQTSLANCQRYYEEIGRASAGGLLMAGCSTVIGQQINTTFPYKVTKRASPTVTRVGTWNLINIASQPNIYGADIDNVLFYAASSATGSAYAQNANANNYITISAEL